VTLRVVFRASIGGRYFLTTRAGTRAREEKGAALVVAVLVAALMTAVASALIATTTTETVIAGAHRASQETFYAADAALERSIAVLSLMPDWSSVLAGSPVAPFDDAQTTPRGPDGRRLDLARLLASRQAARSSRFGPSVSGSDSPRWRLFGRAPLSRVLDANLAAQPAYLLVWVADDAGDGDGVPTADANGQILLYVDAFGLGGAHRAIEAKVTWDGPGVVRLMSWKDVH